MDNRETQFLIDFISNKYLNGSERKKALELAFKELGRDSVSISEIEELRSYLENGAMGGVSEDRIEYNSRIDLITREKANSSEDQVVDDSRDATKQELFKSLKPGMLGLNESNNRIPEESFTPDKNKNKNLDEIIPNAIEGMSPKKKKISHNPLMTTRFLKNFKYDNDTGLKDLVHGPNDDTAIDFDDEVLQKVKNHPNFVGYFLGKRKDDFKGKLPKRVWSSTVKLIDVLENEGVPFNKRTQLHPINDEFLRSEIQKFKQNYRFGSERTESSQLITLITRVSNKVKHEGENYVASFGDDDSSGKFGSAQIVFSPNEEAFRLRANFFTWVPNITNTLWWIFASILKHSNLKGSHEFDKKDKIVEISLSRNRNQDKGYTAICLSIRDNLSFLTKPPETFYDEIKGCDPYLKYLPGIADWSIDCYHPEKKGLTFNMLSESGPSWNENESVGEYFEHKLTFYD